MDQRTENPAPWAGAHVLPLRLLRGGCPRPHNAPCGSSPPTCGVRRWRLWEVAGVRGACGAGFPPLPAHADARPGERRGRTVSASRASEQAGAWIPDLQAPELGRQMSGWGARPVLFCAGGHADGHGAVSTSLLADERFKDVHYGAQISSGEKQLIPNYLRSVIRTWHPTCCTPVPSRPANIAA